MGEFLKFKTSSPSGDLISFLAGIKQLWEDTGKKGVVFQRLGMIGGSYHGADSAYGDNEGNPICFNQYAFDMMRPLLISQEYIEDYVIYDGQPYEIDLDKVRQENFTNQPLGSLNRWFNYVFPQMASDLSQGWISANEDNYFNDKIIINFTERHRNTLINYFFLKEHQDKIVFAGLKKERDKFCEEWNLKLPLLEVNNFFQLAMAVKGCKFLLSNQSFIFQLAEAMKVKRILEIFPMMPNVIPVGENAYDFYHQQALEYYFLKLNQ